MDSWGNRTLRKEERKERKKEGEEEMIRPMENVDEKEEEENKRYRFGFVWRERSEWERNNGEKRN